MRSGLSPQSKGFFRARAPPFHRSLWKSAEYISRNLDNKQTNEQTNELTKVIENVTIR